MSRKSCHLCLGLITVVSYYLLVPTASINLCMLPSTGAECYYDQNSKTLFADKLQRINWLSLNHARSCYNAAY